MKQPSLPEHHRSFNTVRALAVAAVGVTATADSLDHPSVVLDDPKLTRMVEVNAQELSAEELAQRIHLEHALAKLVQSQIDAGELFNLNTGLLQTYSPVVVELVLRDALTDGATRELIMPYLLYTTDTLARLPDGDELLIDLIGSPDAQPFLKYTILSALTIAPPWLDRFFVRMQAEYPGVLEAVLHAGDILQWRQFMRYSLETRTGIELLVASPSLAQAVIERLAKSPTDSFWRFEIVLLLYVHNFSNEWLRQTLDETAIKEENPLTMWTNYMQFKDLFPSDTQKLFETYLPPKPTTEVAVLLPNLKPQLRNIQADVARYHVASIPRAALTPLVQNKDFATPAYWQKINDQLKRQYGTQVLEFDYAKQLIRESAEAWQTDPVALENAALMVARNLGWRGVAVTDETVAAEVERIISVRAELHTVDVLASPQVILAAHGEEWTESKGVFQAGDQRFLPPALMAEVTDRVAQSGGEITTIRPADPALLESVREAKQAFFDTLTHELESATVVLDGHGGPDAFYFADGQIAEAENALEITETDRTVKVTVTEFADVLEERFKAQQAAGHRVAETNLSIVFAACYMSDFVRALAVELQARQVPLPRLMITAAEYGQYGFTTLQDPRASTPLIQILETGSVGNFIEADQIYSLPEQHSNPSVFVPSPDDPHTLMQISGRQDYEMITTRTIT